MAIRVRDLENQCVKYWADAPDDQGPEGWGGRVGITFILP